MTRTTNYKLEVVREKGRKGEKMIEKQKTEAMATKWYRARRIISLFSEEEDKSDPGDDINLN